MSVGTLVEVQRGMGVSEILVVTCTDPIQFRPAELREQFLLEWRRKRIHSGEMAAACDAIVAIKHAMAKAKA